MIMSDMNFLQETLTRRNMLKLTGASAAALAMSALMPGFAHAAAKTLWFNTPFHAGDAEAMEIIVKKFNEEHTDVQLDLVQGSWTEYFSQLYNAVVAGEAPQIGISLDFRMSTIYPALTPLNDSPVGNLIEQAGFKREDYIEYVWDIADIEDKQYAIPLDNTLLGIYYNKAIFREAGLDPDNPPDTRDDFEKAAEAIKKIGKYAFHPGAYGAPRWYRRAWYIFYWQQGGSLLDGDQAAFNNAKGLAALEYLMDVRRKGWNQPGTNGAAQFDTGELGMLMNGTWHYLALAKTDLDWGFMGIPKWFEKKSTWGSNHFLAIPKQAKDKEALILPAAKAIKWISDNSHIWGMLGGHVPMRKQALENPELMASDTWEKTLRIFKEMAFSGVYHPEPRHPKIIEIDAAIEPYIDEAYNGTIEAQEALNKAEEDVNKVLKS
jgi:multiple sugar transport system substrate-binding protein